MEEPSNAFYKRLALIRLITFVIVFTAALLILGWYRHWTPMSQVLIETVVLSSMVMILSLPLAWFRTKMIVDRKEKAERESVKKTD